MKEIREQLIFFFFGTQSKALKLLLLCVLLYKITSSSCLAWKWQGPANPANHHRQLLRYHRRRWHSSAMRCTRKKTSPEPQRRRNSRRDPQLQGKYKQYPTIPCRGQTPYRRTLQGDDPTQRQRRNRQELRIRRLGS